MFQAVPGGGGPPLISTEPEFMAWFTDRSAAGEYHVEQVPLDSLSAWRSDQATGDVAHCSGRFYAIRGLAVRTDRREVTEWSQPIIVQPEVGILGLLVKRIGGVLYCLMQAKMEPGNINTVQLSPTVQATRSNFTRVHEGAPVPYLEHFVAPRRDRVLLDVLQSEQGSWFLRKRNRNMVIETSGEVEPHPDFCWLALPVLHRLLHRDNIVNMDTRTVLAGMPYAVEPGPEELSEDTFRGALARSAASLPGVAKLDSTAVLSWLTELKARHSLDQRLIPLRSLEDWHWDTDIIRRPDGRYFSVIGVLVKASSREVSHWAQPLFAPAGHGIVALIGRQIDGVLHFLMQARTEAGTLDILEIGPTVQCAPGNLPGGWQPPFLDYVLSAPPERIRYDVLHSEEGGRFFHAQNRYLIVEAGVEFAMTVPDQFQWMTVRQMMDLVPFANLFNVEARTLLAALGSLR